MKPVFMSALWAAVSSRQAGYLLLNAIGVWGKHCTASNLRFSTPMNGQPIRKGRGCCFYGCFGSAIVVLVVAIAAILGVRHFVHRAIIKYSDIAPASLPKVEASPSEVKEVQERVAAFKKAIDSGRPVEPLDLDERALNLLLANSPELKGMSDKVHISIEDNQIKSQISLPLDQLPLFRAPGRYLNGSAALKVSLENGVLVVTINSIEVKGEQLPEHIMAGLRTQNLARDIYGDTRTADIMRRLEKIDVKDGKITIRAASPESER